MVDRFGFNRVGFNMIDWHRVGWDREDWLSSFVVKNCKPITKDSSSLSIIN